MTGAAPVEAGDRGARLAWAGALGAITVMAGALRFVDLAHVPQNFFYDAAVRSMGGSWHAFLYGALNPNASLAVDKPPVDLWLQVASTKLFGLSGPAFKYPSALAATAAVPLLGDAVRRLAGGAAALAAAFVLAIVPASVLTSRSDTMDSLMMALLVACAWLLVVGAGRPHERRWLLLAAAVLGLDFNVKLFEPLVAAPALAVFAALTHRPDAAWRPRAGALAAAAGVFAAVSVSWMVLFTLTPRADRPFPLGSTDGSVWSSVFVYNGIDRVTRTPHPDRFGAPSGTVGAPAVEIASAPSPSGAPLRGPLSAPSPVHRARRRRASAAPAGPLRLFEKSSQDYGGIVGVLLAAAIAFGGLAVALRRRELVEPRARAGAIALAVWLGCGYALFSGVGRLHPRYLEALTPAVAAAVGVGVFALVRAPATARHVLALAAGLVVVFGEGVRITGVGRIVSDGRYAALVLTAVALVAMAVSLALRRSSPRRAWPALAPPPLLGALAVIAIAPFPLARDVRLIRNHNGDQALSPSVPSALVTALSAYLRAHQGGARYELAAAAPTLVAPLIVRDGRPVVMITSTDGHVVVGLGALQGLAASGQVRYLLTRGRCPVPRNTKLSTCAAPVEWAVAHGQDVTAQVVPGQRGLLYRIG